MTHNIAEALKQKRPFASVEQEVFLGLRMASARLLDPWAKFVKATAQLSPTQYNVLRILRGSHPGRLSSSELGDRMVAVDPDITRLVDRLIKRGLVKRSPGKNDRRVVEIGITEKGLALVGELDVHAERMPKALLGHLGATKLRQLRQLLEAVISGRGTYP
jgi:DNA-binding MarR family transcriptional regulator